MNGYILFCYFFIIFILYFLFYTFYFFKFKCQVQGQKVRIVCGNFFFICLRCCCLCWSASKERERSLTQTFIQLSKILFLLLLSFNLISLFCGNYVFIVFQFVIEFVRTYFFYYCKVLSLTVSFFGVSRHIHGNFMVE